MLELTSAVKEPLCRLPWFTLEDPSTSSLGPVWNGVVLQIRPDLRLVLY